MCKSSSTACNKQRHPVWHLQGQEVSSLRSKKVDFNVKPRGIHCSKMHKLYKINSFIDSEKAGRRQSLVARQHIAKWFRGWKPWHRGGRASHTPPVFQSPKRPKLHVWLLVRTLPVVCYIHSSESVRSGLRSSYRRKNHQMPSQTPTHQLFVAFLLHIFARPSICSNSSTVLKGFGAESSERRLDTPHPLTSLQGRETWSLLQVPDWAGLFCTGSASSSSSSSKPPDFADLPITFHSRSKVGQSHGVPECSEVWKSTKQVYSSAERIVEDKLWVPSAVEVPASSQNTKTLHDFTEPACLPNPLILKKKTCLLCFELLASPLFSIIASWACNPREMYRSLSLAQ